MGKIMGLSVVVMIAMTAVGAWAVATTPDQIANEHAGPRINAIELTKSAADLPAQQFGAI